MAVIKMSLNDVHRLLTRLEFVAECIRLNYPMDALDEAEMIKRSLLEAMEPPARSLAVKPELMN